MGPGMQVARTVCATTKKERKQLLDRWIIFNTQSTINYLSGSLCVFFLVLLLHKPSSPLALTIGVGLPRPTSNRDAEPFAGHRQFTPMRWGMGYQKQTHTCGISIFGCCF